MADELSAKRFDFERDVWANERKAVRATGRWSFWYKILFSLTFLLHDRALRADWLRNQIWLDSSSDYGLVLWGQRYRIPKYYGESDDDYKARIISERLIARGDASNASRKKILNVVYGIPVSDIRIVRLYDYHMPVGGAIGSAIATRDHAMHDYRIYAPIPSDVDGRLSKAMRMMNDINIGGNVLQLWFDKGAAASGQTQTTDRPLDQPVTSPLRDYRII
jgi:hypothetical protein